MSPLRTTQWIVVAAWIVAFTTLSIMELNHGLDGHRTPWGCAAAFLSALAHGIWITLDARILGRPVGAWRFAAFFFGPFTLWVWMVVSYGLKSLVLIPISFAVYSLPIVLVMVAAAAHVLAS